MDIVREHWMTLLVGGLVPGVVGLFLGEALMAVQFKALQPILAGMTFLTVEIFGALLIDFPLSVVAGGILAKKMGKSDANYGALAGATFLTVFIALICCMMALRKLTTIFDVLRLGDAALLAAQTARRQFGLHFVVTAIMFLAFDYFLCMLGGTIGFNIIRLAYSTDCNGR